MEPTSTPNCHFISRPLEFTKLSFHNFERPFLTLFYSPSPHSDHLISSLQNVSSFFSDPLFLFVDAEKSPDLAKQFSVQIFPTIVISDANKKVLKRVENPEMNEIIMGLEDDIAQFKTNFVVERQRMFSKIEDILGVSPVMAFIKGTPNEPKCGYTSSLLEILKGYGLNFGYFNILEDEGIRNWMRHYAKWNTYPQLHIQKKLVGGLDVVKDLVAKGKFEELIPETARKADPEVKFKRIMDGCKGKIVVFMKDLTDEESRKLAKLLREKGVKFVVSDVNGDKQLEEYLVSKHKASLPLCFVSDQYIGPYQSLLSLCLEKNLLTMVSQSEWSLTPQQKFNFLIETFSVVCFIQGNYEDLTNKDNQKLFAILKKNAIEFEYFNVDFDKEIKEITTKFTGLKSFPQVINKGKVVGGIEVIEEIEKHEEIVALFK